MWMLALGFVRRNWQAMAVALLIAVAWWRISTIVTERDDALSALNAERHAVEVSTEKAKAERAALKAEGERNVTKIKAQHTQNIQHIAGLYTKELSRENKNHRVTVDNLRSELDARLREQSAKVHSVGMSENDTDRAARADCDTAIAGPGEESAEFYRGAYHGAEQYIKTLEVAGAMCAADYNACKSYVDSERGRLGVEQ